VPQEKAKANPVAEAITAQVLSHDQELKNKVVDAAVPILAVEMLKSMKMVFVENGRKDIRNIQQKFNPHHDSLGRFATGSGSGAHMAPDTGGGTGGGSLLVGSSQRNKDELYKEYREVYKEKKGTDPKNNENLVKIAGVKIVCPGNIKSTAERMLAHVIADSKTLMDGLSGVTVTVKNMGQLYGQSKGNNLFVEEKVVNEKGAGFGASIVRHELEHTFLTRKKVPSGKQEPRVRAVTGMFAVAKYSSMAKTNPADAEGFLAAAKASGVKIR
jgi:hypothetical protein